jgi:hypothetical protein
MVSSRRRRGQRLHLHPVFTVVTFLVVFVGCVFGQTDAPVSPSVMKTLSVEQLMDIDVTSVSRRPEKLSDVASAIQVITAEDILAAGAQAYLTKPLDVSKFLQTVSKVAFQKFTAAQ